jgi:hypothetical protein
MKAERLHVGSYVAVYNEGKKRGYRGCVTKIEPERARPHRVKYDDKRKGKEWLNLNVHPFLVVDPPADAPVRSGPVRATAAMLKKRKVEFQNLQPPDNTRELKRAKIKAEQDAAQAPPLKCNEICGISGSRTKRARATSCHHIFCKRCIEYHRNQSAAEAGCPLCDIPVNSTLLKFDP